MSLLSVDSGLLGLWRVWCSVYYGWCLVRPQPSGPDLMQVGQYLVLLAYTLVFLGHWPVEQPQRAPAADFPRTLQK